MSALVHYASERLPMVSVVIVNWNGCGCLEHCLRRVLLLDWPRVEVIVVDNGSTDGSVEFIEEKFAGRVRLLRRTVNSVTGARNQGFAAAAGEIVLSLDNDIVLPDPEIVRRAVRLFECLPRVGALALKIGSADNPSEPLREHWWHPLGRRRAGERFFFTDYFGEGGVFFRRAALRATGGYDALYRQGDEGPDLVLRLLAEGYETLYCPSLVGGELRLRGGRGGVDIQARSLRNRLWTVWKNYPAWRGMLHATPRLAMSAMRAASHGWLREWWRGAGEGVFAPEAIRRRRKPLPTAAWRRLRQIRRGDYLTPDSAEEHGAAAMHSSFAKQIESL
ncbi:MAG: glycosyltransferase [Acidobacteriota bacterium]|nr:glycosyltransferase [Acidobacteriota bacterium]